MEVEAVLERHPAGGSILLGVRQQLGVLGLFIVILIMRVDESLLVCILRPLLLSKNNSGKGADEKTENGHANDNVNVNFGVLDLIEEFSLDI